MKSDSRDSRPAAASMKTTTARSEHGMEDKTHARFYAEQANLTSADEPRHPTMKTRSEIERAAFRKLWHNIGINETSTHDLKALYIEMLEDPRGDKEMIEKIERILEKRGCGVFEIQNGMQ